MSAPVRLILRPPPHTDYVREYPGIPASDVRPPACIQGTVEVRPKPKGIKAVWLRIELKKHEQIPGNKATSRYREHIGNGPTTLWQAKSKGKKASSDPQYEVLLSSDYAFTLPLPNGLPPSVLVDRKNGIGVHYELVATLLSKPKSGMLGSGSKDPVPVVESVPIVIEKHELHPSWPIFAYRAQVEDRRERLNKISMSVKRQTTAYGPGDDIVATIKLRSERLDPVKLARLELTMREVITFRGDIREVNAAGEQKTTDVVEARQWINKPLYPNEEQVFNIRGVLRADHGRVTVCSAKHIIVAYNVGVRAVFERDRGTQGPLSDIVIDHMPATVGSYSREQGDAVVSKIMAAGAPIPPELSSPNPMPLRASVLGDGVSSPQTSEHSAPYQSAPAAHFPPFQLHYPNGYSPATSPSPFVPGGGFQSHSSRPSTADTFAPLRQSLSANQPVPRPTTPVNEEGRLIRQSNAVVAAAKQRLADSRTRESPGPALSAVGPPPAEPAPVVDQPWPSAHAEKERLRAHVVNPSETSIGGISTSYEEQKRLLDEAAERKRQQEAASSSAAFASAAPSSAAPAAVDSEAMGWKSAAEEKKRLYDQAVRLRGDDPNEVLDVPSPPLPPDATRPTSASPRPSTSPHPTQSTSAAPRPSWPTAAEEKERLYREATRARPSDAPEAEPFKAAHPPGYGSAADEKERLYNAAIQDRPALRAPVSPMIPSETAAVEAYQHAIKERERWLAQGGGASSLPSPSPPRAGPSSGLASSTSVRRPPPAPPTASTSAADEKAALAARYRQEELSSSKGSTSSVVGFSEERKRYEEAIAARDRIQAELNSPPTSPVASPAKPAAMAGPSEKEQMARYYEAQAEVAARQREASVEADEDDEPPSFHYVVTDPTPTSTYRSSTHVPAIPLPALTEKEALARYHASQAPPEEAMPGGYMGTPDLSNPLRRTLSAGASSESGTTDEVTLQRDPSIALGKRRAETASPPPASVPYVSPSTRQATWDRRTNLYDIGPAGSPVERFGSPPPRPPKVPLR